MAVNFFTLAVLLLCFGTADVVSAATPGHPPGFCTIGSQLPMNCPKAGTVCAISKIGKPEVDIPHTGTCHKFAPSLMCHHLPSGINVVVGTTFPSGDGCNTCTCEGRQRKGSNATVVCTKTPVADCFADPCQVNKCPAFPAATCQSNYCGGCKADWFLNGNKVDCTHLAPASPVRCRHGGNMAPINCPSGSTCRLDPVPTPSGNPDLARTGQCVANIPPPPPAPRATATTCRQGGNIRAISCPRGQICQLHGAVPTNPDVARTGICIPAPAPAPAPVAAACSCDNSTYQVCGQDGVTYQNPCKARCNGASYFPGPCGSACNCPSQWAPVCGSDNHTYSNTCDAQCHGINGPYKQGECGASTSSSCGCSSDKNPVCGSDGKTYTNACLAKCAKTSYLPGECGQCICIALYDPVCSTTGILYGNQCEARCHGASPPFTKPGVAGTCPNAPRTRPANGSTGR